MTEIARIVDLLESTFEGKPYYGPSVLAALEHVDAEMAVRKRGESHSIWELVLHLAAELDFDRAIIKGTAGKWIEGETTWPAVTETSEAAWNEAVRDLERANRAFVSEVERLDDGILDERPKGMPCSFYAVLQGTIQHNVYHAGQIALMVKQVGT
jgi:uncharacterized damage-inducible protein DinB